MNSADIAKAVTWNPWHGCHKCSPGCQNCFVFAMDAKYGKDTSIVSKGKTTYDFPANKCYTGCIVRLCFTSDFFLEEADQWRTYVWDVIRRHSECTFVTTTKRPERILQCLPDWWGEGLDNFRLNVSIENQEMADKRLPILLDVTAKNRGVFCSPLIAPITLYQYLATGLIDSVNVGGESAPNSVVRPCRWEWVRDLYLEAQITGTEFYFHQTGSMFIRNQRNIGTWNFKQQSLIADRVQQELESMSPIR